MPAPVILETIPVGPLQTNAYLVACPAEREAVLVDPGADGRRLALLAQARELRVTRILLTHAHVDHVGGIAEVCKVTGATVWLNEADRPLYDSVAIQAQIFGLRVGALPPPDGALRDGDLIEVGTLRAAVLETPGHSPGSICLYFEPQQILLSGDTLFEGGIGRTDLPGGSYPQIAKSIRSKLFALPGATRVYPGHGLATTIGDEKRNNPFVRETTP